MKKIITAVIFFCFTGNLSAQFFQGLGLMGGLSYYRQKWWIINADGSESTTKQRYTLRFNGCVFAEFIKNDHFHWRTEIEYNQKGCKEGDLLNKVDYFAWNNFLKIYEEEFEGTPYLLIGPRVEYLFRQATASPAITGSFKPLHFSWSAGVGWEFTVFGNFKPCVEIHYNADIDKAYLTPELKIVNRPWQLRVGVRILFNKNSCPPVYK